MDLKVICVLLVTISALNASSTLECDENSPPAELTVDYRKCLNEKCQNDYPFTDRIINQLLDWKVPEDKIVGEHLLCVLKGLRVYSNVTGLNATDFSETVFNLPYHNQTIIKPAAKTCTEKYQSESEADKMVQKILNCTIEVAGRDEFFNKG